MTALSLALAMTHQQGRTVHSLGKDLADAQASSALYAAQIAALSAALQAIANEQPELARRAVENTFLQSFHLRAAELGAAAAVAGGQTRVTDYAHQAKERALARVKG